MITMNQILLSRVQPMPETLKAHLGVRKLSGRMGDILFWIALTSFKNNLRLVPWKHAGEWTAVDRASESRTLRRLEERGLVIRYAMGEGHRTTDVEITDAGFEAIMDDLKAHFEAIKEKVNKADVNQMEASA